MNVLSGNFPNVNDVYKYKIYFSTLPDENIIIERHICAYKYIQCAGVRQMQ